MPNQSRFGLAALVCETVWTIDEAVCGRTRRDTMRAVSSGNSVLLHQMTYQEIPRFGTAVTEWLPDEA